LSRYKNIPAIDEIISNHRVVSLLAQYDRDFIVNIIRRVTDDYRKNIANTSEIVERGQIAELIINSTENYVKKMFKGTMKKVINGTGVVLHTNLGRAPLSEDVMQRVVSIATVYNNLEINLEKGTRGNRYYHVEELLQKLTGAEAALVVNNNAAAVLLALTTIAREKEVIVSRGQLVEIGGSFRIPEVMKLSGAKLVEVGTTNKTYINDFIAQINENTGLLFAAHTSNYKIIGFSEDVRLEQLVELGNLKQIPVMQDLGSGILYNLDRIGLDDEITVQDCVKTGVDIVTFSGDKLLGGPQAGIIVGKKSYIEAMKKNQLLRALRVDKLTITALEGTLLQYLTPNPENGIPVIKMLTYSKEELKRKAYSLYETLEVLVDKSKVIERVALVELKDMVGGGAYPTYEMPGYGVELTFYEDVVEKYAKQLRLNDPAILTRKKDDKMLISVRTLLTGDIDVIANVFKDIMAKE